MSLRKVFQVNLLAAGPAEITRPLLRCFQYRRRHSSSKNTESWNVSSRTSPPRGWEMAKLLPSRHLDFGMIEVPTSQSWPGMRPGPGEKIGDPDQDSSEATPYIHEELPPVVRCTIGELLNKYVGEGPQVSYPQHGPSQTHVLQVQLLCWFPGLIMTPKGSAIAKGPLMRDNLDKSRWAHMMQLQEWCQLGWGAGQWCRAGSGFAWWMAWMTMRISEYLTGAESDLYIGHEGNGPSSRMKLKKWRAMRSGTDLALS